MRPPIALLAVMLAVGLSVAAAAPPSARVVLVDPDPELRRAMTTALAPWRLEVITDASPVDAAGAPARADALSARFVVWRERGTLVVFDRERGDVLHREGAGGELDPIAAAAAALTVKTLMRLPPPDGETSPPRGSPGTELRVQAGLATRFAGEGTGVGGRFVGAAMLRPVGDSGWRFGVLGDLGSEAAVEKSGFKGGWSDWSLVALASYTIARGRLEIEPYAGVGVTRSTFAGEEMMTPRSERETLATIRGGGWVRWRAGRWTIGSTLGVDVVPGTPTYTRLNNSQEIFTVPSTGLVLGLVVAADLGR